MLVVLTNTGTDRHDTGAGHPESPARTVAAFGGLMDAELSEALVEVAPRPARPEELHRVHSPAYLASLERVCSGGGGQIDPDTVVSPGSWETALSAAGAGLVALEVLQAGHGEAALVLVRPPGHHAGPSRAGGFCLINNVAVAAATLVSDGERVAIVDFDVHHGDGTQGVFWETSAVLYVSVHQAGLYPRTGWAAETGAPGAEGTTLNIPLPAGASGPALRRAFDTLIAPVVEAFAPSWVLVSAGFDGHRADPLADFGLSAGDYASIGARLRALTPRPGRLVAFLEGGYDLGALRASVGAFGSALAGGTYLPEAASADETGCSDVDAIASWWASHHPRFR